MESIEDTIYTVCIPGESVRYEARSRIVPIMGGSHALKEDDKLPLRDQGYVFDDEKAFFSPLNSRWGELSCIHWMLLNAEEPIIGNAQYRRNWIEPSSEWYNSSTLYIPEPAVFQCSLEQQFRGGHTAFNAPAITRELADTGSWLFTRKQIDAVWAQNLFYGCNMARGPKHSYKHFMTMLFNALLPIWHKHKEAFMNVEGYDKRAIAFIAERVMSGMVLYRDSLLPKMEIATAPIGFISS